MPNNIQKKNPLLFALFLVSAASIGFETQMTRYFAIASWSEYGYWVISIAMVGYSASGVALCLFKDVLLPRGRRLLFFLALGLMAWTSLGFHLATLNSFNPLEFQNQDLWWDQFINIWKYYAALFPFFFMAGSFVGLSFLVFSSEIPRVYGADLAGAGAGAVAVLLLMFWIHPFYLGIALLIFLAGAAVLALRESSLKRQWAWLAGTAALLAGCLAFSIFLNQAAICEFKAIYPAQNVEDCRELARVSSPRGDYRVLDNFTERLDIDLSNNYELLQASGPPEAFGVYQDGNRLGGLPRTAQFDLSYVRAALDNFPYELKKGARVLLVGTRGGFKIREALASGAAEVVALEPEPVIHALMTGPFSQAQAPALSDSRVRLLQAAPESFLAASREAFDIIDLSSELLDQGEANKYHFTSESLQAYYDALREEGVISLPASIREFTVYALKLMESSRAAMIKKGVEDPENHLVLYRSSWNARLLVSKSPWALKDLETLKQFCSDRSFDVSYRPGPVSLQEDAEVFNELPATPFEADDSGVEVEESTDSLRDDSRQLLSEQGEEFRRANFFNLRASTLDRPSFHSVLRLGNLGKILANISLVPKEEIGYLINLAVLVQSLIFAVLVLGLPLLRREKLAQGLPLAPAILYFCCLGLGYLFVEIALIEKASYFFSDRTTAFSLVLSGMLVFSGVGSWASGQFQRHPSLGLEMAIVLAALWLFFAWLGGDWALQAFSSWPLGLKIFLLMLLVAPLSFAMGFPFSLGLSSWGRDRPGFLPWAWALNGAFSVVATPLANLVGISSGISRLWIYSLLLYGLAYGMFYLSFNRLKEKRA